MSLFPPPPPGIYEYTEVLTFHFSDPSVPPALSDETTLVGKVWASTLKTYIELEYTGIVYWTLVHGVPQRAKLFIDWKTHHAREQFLSSTELETLGLAWNSVISVPVHSVVYRLPWGGHRGHPGLHTGYDTVSAFFTFSFSNALSEDDKKMLDPIRLQFGSSVLHSLGGVVSTAYSSGWDMDNTSCCAIFRYISIQKMQTFLQESQLFQEMQSFSTGGIEIEFMEVRCFDQGWQGSVDRTRPENPGLDALFARMRELRERVGPREPGRSIFG